MINFTVIIIVFKLILNQVTMPKNNSLYDFFIQMDSISRQVSWTLEIGHLKKVRSRKSEVKSQKAEVRSWKSEVGSRNSEVGSPSSAFVVFSEMICLTWLHFFL